MCRIDEIRQYTYTYHRQMACVKESIRVGMAVPGRLPRAVPAGDPFVVEGKVVPPGVSDDCFNSSEVITDQN